MEINLEDGKYTYRECDGRQEVLRYGEPWRDLTGDKFLSAMAHEIERLKSLVVMRFDLEQVPEFSQGFQWHEVLEPVTAEHCTWMIQEIERLQYEVVNRNALYTTRNADFERHADEARRSQPLND